MYSPNFSGNVGMPLAHPDDHITEKDAIVATHSAGGVLHELTYSFGRNASDNFRAQEDPWFSIQNGDRRIENHDAARILGITTLTMLDATDGKLADEFEKLVQPTIDWIFDNDINLLVTTGGLYDHPDHIASAGIARWAAAEATISGRPVDILELQYGDHKNRQDGSNIVSFPRSSSAIFMSLWAARMHKSQFRFAKAQDHSEWPASSGGYVIHPETQQALGQYSLWGGSNYLFIKSEDNVLAAA